MDTRRGALVALLFLLVALSTGAVPFPGYSGNSARASTARTSGAGNWLQPFSNFGANTRRHFFQHQFRLRRLLRLVDDEPALERRRREDQAAREHRCQQRMREGLLCEEHMFQTNCNHAHDRFIVRHASPMASIITKPTANGDISISSERTQLLRSFAAHLVDDMRAHEKLAYARYGPTRGRHALDVLRSLSHDYQALIVDPAIVMRVDHFAEHVRYRRALYFGDPWRARDDYGRVLGTVVTYRGMVLDEAEKERLLRSGIDSHALRLWKERRKKAAERVPDLAEEDGYLPEEDDEMEDAEHRMSMEFPEFLQAQLPRVMRDHYNHIRDPSRDVFISASDMLDVAVAATLAHISFLGAHYRRAHRLNIYVFKLRVPVLDSMDFMRDGLYGFVPWSVPGENEHADGVFGTAAAARRRADRAFERYILWRIPASEILSVRQLEFPTPAEGNGNLLNNFGMRATVAAPKHDVNPTFDDWDDVDADAFDSWETVPAENHHNPTSIHVSHNDIRQCNDNPYTAENGDPWPSICGWMVDRIWDHAYPMMSRPPQPRIDVAREILMATHDPHIPSSAGMGTFDEDT